MASDVNEASGSGEAAFVVLQSDGLKKQSSGSQQCKRDNEDDGVKHSFALVRDGQFAGQDGASPRQMSSNR